MARSVLAAFPLFLIGLSASAAAQDFGTQWADRVVHRILDDSNPLATSPMDVQFSAGEIYSYDSNIFLTHTNRTSDSIFITFAQAILKYAQTNFDAEADLTANYSAYSSTSEASTDEERFFGRIRAHGSTMSFQLAEIARRESSPTDAVFASRVARFISDTTPEAVFRLNDDFIFEVLSNVQVVHYRDEIFQTADNINSRSIATLAWMTKQNGLEVLLQAGYLSIHYQDFDAPPDAYGWLGRLGVRGDFSPDLRLIALAGATHVGSENDQVLGRADPVTTLDAEFHLTYTATALVTVYADYSRRVGFASGDSSFQIVDSADAIIEYTPRDDLKFRARVQHDRVHTSAGDRRSYFSAAAGPEYSLLEGLLLEAHATYRVGTAQDSGGQGSFKDLILSVGIVGVF